MKYIIPGALKRNGFNMLRNAKYGYTDKVRHKLDRGVDPNFQNQQGVTALMRAAEGGFFDTVELLLERGAVPNIQNINGSTALIIGIRNIWNLRQDGHPVDSWRLVRDTSGWREYERAGYVKPYDKTAGYNIAKSLLNHGADPNIQDNDGNTALMHAANQGFSDIVKLLLEGGADPDIQNRSGNTALMMASYQGHTEIVRLLLDHGADPNIKNRFGNSALMRAEERGYNDIATLIREHEDLQKGQQNLAFMKSLNTRLGDDTQLNLLDQDVVRSILDIQSNYDPSVHMRMKEERRKDSLDDSSSSEPVNMDHQRQFINDTSVKSKKRTQSKSHSNKSKGKGGSKRSRKRRRRRNYTRRKFF